MPDDYVWAAACKDCHSAQYSAWATTKHAHALARLSTAERTADGGCIGCHVTGAPSLAADEANANVQCEACDMPVAEWRELNRTDALLVDVREPDEFAGGHIPNAINLPLSHLRDRYAALPANRDIWTCCGVGQRAYFASRFLAQHGYRSRNLSGGYTTYRAFNAAGRTP